MGEIVKVTCSSCRADWQCITGCGIMHGTLEAVAAIYPEATRKEIKECVGDTMFPVYDFGFHLSHCKHCSSITSVPVLKLPDNHREFIGNCGKCGHPTELIESPESTPCPACHKETLSVRENGMWD